MPPDSYYPAVVAISVQEGNSLHHGSGTLLAGGRYIVTAAHLFQNGSHPADISISNRDSIRNATAKAIYTHPDWDLATYNNDIAIIELEQPITSTVGLSLYRGALPIEDSFIRVGYSNGSNAAQHIGTNIYDSPGEALNAAYNRQIIAESQLIYDFDNGSSAQNILGNVSGSDYTSSTAPTANETLARSGDSGGPGLINKQIAGIASYIISDTAFDSDPNTPSSAGEAGADTNVSQYIEWIDEITGTIAPASSPTTSTEVEAAPVEADTHDTLNYFLLCSETAQDKPVRLWYQTQDGSATAGEDYIATSGWVEIEAGALCATIGVRIIGDTEPEPDETFFLHISDPSQQWLPGDTPLIAEHQIKDNDLFSG